MFTPLKNSQDQPTQQTTEDTFGIPGNDFQIISIRYMSAVYCIFNLIQPDGTIGFYPPGMGINPNDLTYQLNRINNINTQNGVFSSEDFKRGLIIYIQLAQSPAFGQLIQESYPHHIFLTCIMIGHKYVQDIPYDMLTWSQFMLINRELLIQLELLILKAINFNIPSDQLTFIEMNGGKVVRRATP